MYCISILEPAKNTNLTVLIKINMENNDVLTDVF